MNDYPGPAASAGPTVLAPLMQQFVAGVAAGGVSAATLLAAAGLSPEQLADPNGRVPASAVERLVRCAVTSSADPLLGLHIAEKIEAAGFGVTGYMVQACSILREVVELVMRYEGLVSDIGQTSLLFQPGSALWCWDCETDDKLFRRHATEYILSSYYAIYMRWVKPPVPPLQALYLRHPPPLPQALSAEYERIFACPVYFNKPVSALVLAADALKLPLTNPDEVLREVLEQHALQLLDRRDKPASLLERARVQLRKLLHQGKATRETLAEALGMSARHMHRQLDPEGYTYQQLLDELRLELACQHLSESSDSIYVIAERLQFTEGQSFIRWFRKVSGQTPGQYRLSKKNV